MFLSLGLLALLMKDTSVTGGVGHNEDMGSPTGAWSSSPPRLGDVRYRLTDSATGLSVTVAVGVLGNWGFAYDTPPADWPDPSRMKAGGAINPRLSETAMQAEVKSIAYALLKKRLISEEDSRRAKAKAMRSLSQRCRYCKRRFEGTSLCAGCGAPT